LGDTCTTCTHLVTILTGHLSLCPGSHVPLRMCAALATTEPCCCPTAGSEPAPKGAFWDWVLVRRALCHVLMVIVLVLGAVKLSDGQEGNQPTMSMVVPPPSHQTGTSAYLLSMAWMELSGAYCCNMFKLAHLSSKHHKYGGEQLKIASSLFLKNVLMCSAGCSCCYETKYFPSTVISL